MRVVVVGSGVAGLAAAFRASARHDVVLVTKSELAASNTRLAQGGIAAALSADDSVASHIADTLQAGGGLADAGAVAVLCTEGPARVRDLIALGLDVDRDPLGGIARGREAAHAMARIVHAGGDATGREVENVLIDAVHRAHVELREHTFLAELVVEHGDVTGVDVIGPDGRLARIDADAVVLATGGAGQLYLHTTNAEVATGDGIAAAARAGAQLADLEFVQFHPTALAVAGTPLVSEAVRGEGAVLLDESGRRFLVDVHPDAELAPRDVVARGIADAMARQGGRPVLLDATRIERERGVGFLAARFPGVTAITRAHGFDWTREPVPVTPAAHYAMGGVRTDLDGRTSIPGLLAVGEVACTGVHGANRLASNSLLEGLVFAWRAADALERLPQVVEERRAKPDASRNHPRTTSVVSRRVRFAGAPQPPEFPTRTAIQHLMWQHVGLTRDEEGLTAARDTLAAWRVDGDTIADRETRNLLELAILTTRAALARVDSVGAHHRRDAPASRTSAPLLQEVPA